METTGKALVGHWTWAAEKGLMNRNTANGLKAACTQVLGVLDDWENVDVSELDVDQTFARFQNLRKKDFKPKVLDTYRRRFRLAVSSYLAYQQDPRGWKPGIVERPGAQRERTGARGRDADEARGQPATATGLFEYPFPIRDGQTARLILPRDLKAAEVKRLTAFMATLVADYGDDGGAR